MISAAGGKNYLACLNFTGKKKLWEKDIGTGTVQRAPAISRHGVLYIVIDSAMSAFDLERDGEPAGQPYTLAGKLSNFTDLTVGNDGSLYVALQEDNVNYLCGFTPKLRPFLKSGPFRSISTVTVSADGSTVFAQTE